MDLASATDPVCYVQCNFCNTILAGSDHALFDEYGESSGAVSVRAAVALLLICIYGFCSSQVSVPRSSMLMAIVTVRCGHCANLLSLNMPPSNSLHQFPLQDLQKFQKQHLEGDQEAVNNIKDHLLSGSSSSSSTKFDSPEHEQPRPPPIRPPEKRHRVPSAYNRFIKEEIQRIKAGNPKISHREAFSTAAKNWAHFPHIHFGLKMDGNNNNNKNKQAKMTLEKPFSAESTQKHLMVSTDPWIN